MKKKLAVILFVAVAVIGVKAHALMAGSQYDCTSPGIAGSTELDLTTSGYLNINNQDFLAAGSGWFNPIPAQFAADQNHTFYLPEDANTPVIAVMVDFTMAHTSLDPDQLRHGDERMNVTDINEASIQVVYSDARGTVTYDCKNQNPH